MYKLMINEASFPTDDSLGAPVDPTADPLAEPAPAPEMPMPKKSGMASVTLSPEEVARLADEHMPAPEMMDAIIKLNLMEIVKDREARKIYAKIAIKLGLLKKITKGAGYTEKNAIEDITRIYDDYVASTDSEQHQEVGDIQSKRYSPEDLGEFGMNPNDAMQD